MDQEQVMEWLGQSEWGARGTIHVRSYPSGEPLIAAPADIPIRLLVRPRSLAHLMAALFYLDALAERGHRAPELVLPCVPGARQDRLNHAGDYLFTAKSIAKEINARRLPSVTICDPHSDVIAALIDRCQVVRAEQCVGQYFATHHYDAVVSPDAGAEKRAGAIAKNLHRPLLHGWKVRDVATGAISGFGLEDWSPAAVPSPEARMIPGAYTRMPARVLVVDDICDAGGTFIGLAKILKGRGIEADLYVTHGYFTKGTAELLTHYRRVLTTDSLVLDRPGVEVIHICDQLLKEGHL